MSKDIIVRELTVRRYRIYQKRFQYLYEVERRRIDDCYKMIIQEYAVSEQTLARALRAELPEEKKESNPAQMELFKTGDDESPQITTGL